MESPQRFRDRVVVVTGAASGIGAETARRFAREGATLLLADIETDRGERVAAETHGVFQETDVTDEAQVCALLDHAVERHGHVDILINNAGIMGQGTLPELDADSWRRVIEIDLHSVFYGCRAAIPHFRASGGGIIVNTASISGIGGDYALPSYNAAKAGVVNFTRSLAIEHADQNIRVNCVCPGPIDTPMTEAAQTIDPVMAGYEQAIPMGRFGRADEIAAAICFLASDDATYVTGHALVIDGGLTACTGQPNFRRSLQPD
jgi:meso-butanediol dehydrogenase/(S,S)-butanediol dehydrogenase/diacetyl reductase